MLGLIPAPYRWLALALLALALFGYGYVKGRLAGEERLQAFVAKVEAQGQAAQARAAKRAQEALQATQEVSDAYAQTLTAVRADYDRRLRNARARAGRVPEAPASAPKPHEFREPGSIPDSELRDRIATLEIEIAELELRLATAATQIEAWKDYGRRVIAWAEAN